VWSQENGYWLPDNIITRKPERFVFDKYWNLLWKKSQNEKIALDHPYKWLTFHHNPDDENPYGTSDLRCVYWPWTFKKAGYEFWLMATEKFSVKTVLALFEMTGVAEDAIQERAQTLAQLLQGVSSGSSSALANVRDVKELSMSGELAGFNALVESCDIQIAYGLTGQSLASNNPSHGTQALGTVQASMFQEDARGIALELQQVLQKAVNWTVWLNFGPDAVAPIFEFDLEQRAPFDQVMSAIDHEVPVSKEALYSYYKIPKPKDEEDAFVRSAPGEGFGLSDSDRKKKRHRLVIF
jgi:phage gp29-like protein